MLKFTTRATAVTATNGRSFHPAIETDGKVWHWPETWPSAEVAQMKAQERLTAALTAALRVSDGWPVERSMQHGAEFFLRTFQLNSNKEYAGSLASVEEFIRAANAEKPKTEQWFRTLVLESMRQHHKGLTQGEASARKAEAKANAKAERKAKGHQAKAPKGKSPATAPTPTLDLRKTKPKFNAAAFLADLGL